MKRIVFATLVVTLLLACSKEQETFKQSMDESLTLITDELIRIEKEELPVLSPRQAGKLGFKNLDNDHNRKAVIDTRTNTLKLPYNPDTSVKALTRDGIGVCVRIIIAKLNPNNNCIGNCIDCIGFRCGVVVFTCPTNDNTEENNLHRNPSQEREQTATVIVDENNAIIEYQFHNEIDWNNLANN